MTGTPVSGLGDRAPTGGTHATFSTPFYSANRDGAKVSQGTLDQFWLWSMQAGLKSAYECIKAFSEADFTEDLKKVDVPTLVLQGKDDQIVPVHDADRAGVSSQPSGRARRGLSEGGEADPNPTTNPSRHR